MNCRRCGKELNGSMRCNFCGYENTEGNTRELTRIEKNFYDGVTIDADSVDGQKNYRSYEKKSSSYKFYYNGGSQGFFSKLVGNFISGIFSGSKIAKIAAVLIFVALSALMFFIALPIMFVILAVGIVLFIISQFK